MIDSNKEVAESEILEFFTVDNNTYKVLSQNKDDNTVMFWKYEKLDDSKSIIINNNVNYNGHNFNVKYVYEEAFYKSSKNVKNIIIGKGVLGFCDSSGNLITILNKVFKDQKELQSVDFGNTNFIFGENCFENCKAIVNVEMPENMNKMEGYCFDKCSSLRNIDLSTITELKGQSNFANCNKLEGIGQINNEVTELPDKTFMWCSNLRINSLNNTTKLGNECFEYCRALNENIVTDVEEIGDKCFFGCNFKEVYLKKAKKVGYNAFGEIQNLKKIRFGNPSIPFLEKNIAEGSSVNEWVYPLDYKTQPDYLEFLSKLRISKVIWFCNYENMNGKVTQDVRLNSLTPPSSTREGYEIEGWYKEPECINKVNMIADLGEIVDSDLVIKNPVLYAKWTTKKPTMPEESSDSKEPTIQGETKESSDSKESMTTEEVKEENDFEEPTTPGEEKEPIDPGKPTKPIQTKEPSDHGEPTTSEETNESSGFNQPTAPEDINSQSDFDSAGNLNNSNTSNNQNENNDDNIEYENNNFSSMLYEPRKTKNYINNFIVKIEDENKDVYIKQTKNLSLENEIIKNIFVSTVKKSDIEIKNLNWSYRDNVNSNIEIIKSGDLSEIIKNGQCIGIYLKSNDYFNNNTIIEMNITNIIKPSKLYFYSEELGKFVLVDEKLQINNGIIKIKPNNRKEYLITQFDLNEDNVATQGWNKVLPQQSNAILSKHINELSWVYIQDQELSKGWIKDVQENNWYFMNEKGIMETGWLKDKDDKWYYLNTISDGSKGAMKIGWNKINNKWYYIQNDGVLAVNTVIDGYAVGYDGKLI
ncbi:leucine-rich repeat protein [Clostridium sp.]|uniref:leucine-rich repeat protein n=1 Tax=Clostridium sp. TaxID=1506 RepID=UPI0025BE3D26|nr:leucine-rich repeat protein [Clostridium sp.]